ncbi:putative syncoilin [Scophthalmus maximus]|uniref:Putative syncoilin n=1 Tax=Scophthalmus maximus TaxID=52904 RepID=A0A2U9CJD3_SCOMX|nr:putative syncoilin [Scophthalmus maximus]
MGQWHSVVVDDDSHSAELSSNCVHRCLRLLSGLSPPSKLEDSEGSVGEKDMASADDSPVELCGFVGEIPEASPTDSETVTRLDKWTQHHVLQLDQAVVDNVGQLFEHCIQQVSRLEKQRDGLIQELLRLQEPLLQVVGHLRGKVEETQRLLTLAQLDYAAVFEEVRQVKRKLFATARDCIQSQVALATREYEVAQSAVTQLFCLTVYQQLPDKFNFLHDEQLFSPHRPRAMSDISQCRQAAVRLQRRLSGSVKALEGWYEPRLMALLKRRQVGEEALRKSREQAADLRASLGPLREDIQTLEVRRSCLDQRISLMERERVESITQHKATVETLKETLRELEVEFEVQTQSKKHLEDLKDGLLTELTFLRGCDDASKTTAEEEP